MSSLVNLFLFELWRAWIKLQEVDHSKHERRADLIFPAFLSLGAVLGFGGAETPPAQAINLSYLLSTQYMRLEGDLQQGQFCRLLTDFGRLNSTGTQQRNGLQEEYNTGEFWWPCSVYHSMKLLFCFNSSNRLDVALIHYCNSFLCCWRLMVMSLLMAVHIVALWHWHQQQNIPVLLANLLNLLLTKQLWKLLYSGNDSVLGFMRLPWIKDCKCCCGEESHSATRHVYWLLVVWFFFPQQLLLMVSLFGDSAICVGAIILPFLGNIIKIPMSLAKLWLRVTRSTDITPPEDSKWLNLFNLLACFLSE